MAKKQFMNSIASIVSQTAAVESRFGLRLSDIVYEPLEKLTSNVLNEEFFDREEEIYVERLKADIQERGILVPLVAKSDGTLLAGHNRLHIARQLGLSIVPVQYVEDALSVEDERKFVINDNLLRRQLTNDQRIKLYQKLYPNFDARIRSVAGRPQKIEKNHSKNNNVDSVHISQKNTDKDNISLDTAPLTAADIAKDTGQSVTAVQKQLQRRRKEEEAKSKEVSKNHQEPNVQSYHVDTKLLRKVEKGLHIIESAREEANEATRKEVMKKLKAFIKKSV